MIFKSGFSRSEINNLTYRELIEYVNMYYDIEAQVWFDFFKTFAVYNCESTSVATHGKKKDLDKYLNQVRRRKLKIVKESSSNIEDQFSEVNFG